MNKKKLIQLIIISCLIFPRLGICQSSFWKKTASEYSNIFDLEEKIFFKILENVPSEAELVNLEDAILLDFPTPEGQFQSFYIYETPVFENLSNKDFYQYKTYSGRGVKNRSAHLKMELTPSGLSAFITDEKGESWFIQAQRNGKYQLEKKQATDEKYDCLSKAVFFEKNKQKSNFSLSGELYIYRLALSASGEYFQFWGSRDSTLAALVRTLNRMNLIFERDLAIRLQLIDDIQFIIFDDPLTDPFELNGNQNVQNQQYLDRNIGVNEYDIGHVLMVDDVPNGFGSVGSACVDGRKGRGYSVLPDPSDDSYIIDFLVHELGHQLGGNHTFSHCGDSGGGIIPVEPGSGSTIMAYGGLAFCGEDNFVEHASPYFHSASIEEIYQFTRAGEGSACATVIQFPNSAPQIELDSVLMTIPYLTPFELSGSARDLDGDTLSFSWEQIDAGAALPLGQIQAGSPLFRSRPPVMDSSRIFPAFSSLLDGQELPEERLPDFSGALNFRLTVRDNHFRGGGVSWQEVSLEVTEQAGPFRVTAPFDPVTWGLGNSQLIQWEVANTDNAPVGVDQVDIYFVYDSIGSLPESEERLTVKIAGPLPNNGEAFIEIPENLEPGSGWLKVKGHNSPFFDLSDHPITLMLTVANKETVLAGKGVRVFPNPARDHVFIERKDRGGMDSIFVEWIDVYGRILGKKELELGNGLVKLKIPEEISKGWYFIRIQYDEWFLEKIYIH